MGLIARVTRNGKATNCTRCSRVLLTLPVLVIVISFIARVNHTIDLIVYDAISCSFNNILSLITFYPQFQ